MCSRMIFLYSGLSLGFPLVHFGEVLRARVAQSKCRPAPTVSQHHVRSGKGVSSAAYRRSRAAILRRGQRPDES